MRSAVAQLLVMTALALAVPVAAEESDSAAIEAMAERLAQARKGELSDVEPVWLHPWELPSPVRRDFTPPDFAMRVAGDDPYVMADGRAHRPGDEVDGHTILTIEQDGVVVEVEGYPVLVK